MVPAVNQHRVLETSHRGLDVAPPRADESLRSEIDSGWSYLFHGQPAQARRKGGCSARRDLMLRVQRDEMRGMAVVRLGLFEVLKPFLQLTMLADLQWW
jgi:hypothetical protein